MNSYQWGDSTESWKEEGAEEYAARKEDGSTYRHVYEIFSGNGLTPMCMDTQFWRDKYSSLCDTVVNQYHVDGVYMDQACNSMACYDPDHGHTLGGGDSESLPTRSGALSPKVPMRSLPGKALLRTGSLSWMIS